MTHRSWSAGAMVIALLSGCADSAILIIEPETLADLKLTHATQGVGAVDVDVGGARVITGLTFGNSSGITHVNAGMQHVTIRSGATVIGEMDAALTTQHLNAIAFVDGKPQLSTLVTPDTGQAATNRANIRLINVVGEDVSDPTLLYVYVSFPGAPADSTARLGVDAKIATHGSLMYFDPGHFTFTVAPQNGNKILLASAEFDVAAGEKRAVVLKRNGPTYSLQVVVEP